MASPGRPRPVLCSVPRGDTRLSKPAESPQLLHFGQFQLDLRTGELFKEGDRVKLQEQPCKILALLIERPGELVSREELRKKLWPDDTFVDFDHGLNIAINKLRDALGDSAEKPRFIETLPRRGYRFIAPVTSSLEDPPLSSQPSSTPVLAAAEVPGAADATQSTATIQVAAKQETVRLIWRKLLLAAAVLLIVSGGAWWWLRSYHQPHQYAIAVLPFKNLSPEPNSDYFSDGLTDELIRDLSVIDGLQVKSRTSSFVFKDKPRDVRDVGRQLGANLLLEGSVLRSSDRLRVNVDLVRVADNATLWSGRYDRDFKDVFAVQDEISVSIVNELRLKHVGGHRRYDANLEAYDLYLRAREATDDLQAITLLRQVTAKDPDFAPAYAELSSIYADMRHPRRLLVVPDAEPQMRAAAEKAIQLDPLLAEPHAATAVVYADDLAWNDAERSFQRALELNPNSQSIHTAYAMMVLQPEGRFAEALQQIRKTATLDPLSSQPSWALLYLLIETGAYDEALEDCRRLMPSNPRDDDLIAGTCARVMWFTGMHEEAIAILEKLGPSSRGFLGYMYGRIGRRLEAEAIAAERDPAAIRHRALVYAGLGDKDRVFETFEKLAAMHDHIVDIYSVFPEFALVRDDPRMQEFRKKRGLPWPPETK